MKVVTLTSGLTRTLLGNFFAVFSVSSSSEVSFLGFAHKIRLKTARSVVPFQSLKKDEILSLIVTFGKKNNSFFVNDILILFLVTLKLYLRTLKLTYAHIEGQSSSQT